MQINETKSTEPVVWAGMTQAQIDFAYSPRMSVANANELIQSYTDLSTPMYALPHCQRGISYVTKASLENASHVDTNHVEDQFLDYFPVVGNTNAPLFVFIHGGYWRALGSCDAVFMAKTLNALGIAVASINYSLSPKVSLETIVAQCQTAALFLHANAQKLGFDAHKMIISGSSAGGHLAGMLLSADWQTAHGFSAAQPLFYKGLVISGLHDMRAMMHTLPQAWLQLDLPRAMAMSPQFISKPFGTVGLRVAVGGYETDAFKQQSHDYHLACVAAGIRSSYHEIAQRNHFDILLDWMQADSEMTQLVMQ